MKLYDWEGSYNSRKILAVSFEADMPMETQVIDMDKGEHKSAAALSKNPNGKVPVLENGGFAVWESNAIMCYVAAKDPARRLLPTNPEARAQVDQWLFWQTAHLGPAFGRINYERTYKAEIGHGAPDQNVIDSMLLEVNRFVTVLDGWLANHEYVAGDLSVADFAIAASMSVRDGALIDISGWKNVVTYLNKIESRQSWQAAMKVW